MRFLKDDWYWTGKKREMAIKRKWRKCSFLDCCIPISHGSVKYMINKGNRSIPVIKSHKSI